MEFQQLSILVTKISERRLLVLFMDGLMDPLRGWIKALNSKILREAIKKYRDMDQGTINNKAPFQEPTKPKDPTNPPFQRET